MSQQEFQSQTEESKQSQAEEEIYARPRPRSHKRKAEPKSEHPSTYEETIPPYSYRAQDIREPAQKQQLHANQQSGARRQGFSPDGDAFETGYRPYKIWAQRTAPSWARQRRGPRSVGRLIFLVILAVILLPVLFKVLAFLLAALAVVVFGFLFFALIAVAIVAMIFFALRRSFGWPGHIRWRW